MVKVESLHEALWKIRKGCTELNLYRAYRDAPLHKHTPHRRTRAHACRRGACGAPAPSARRTRARRAHTARAPAPRAAGNDIKGLAALVAIQSILEANKARPPASVRHAFASARDPDP